MEPVKIDNPGSHKYKGRVSGLQTSKEEALAFGSKLLSSLRRAGRLLPRQKKKLERKHIRRVIHSAGPMLVQLENKAWKFKQGEVHSFSFMQGT